MPTECLASWKSPLLAGIALGTVFLMIGIDMTAAEFSQYRQDQAAAAFDPSAAVTAPIDGPIFISVALLCYIIGIISSCRKYFKYSTTAVCCPCCRKVAVPDVTDGQQTRTTSVDTLTEPSSREVEADLHVLTEAKKSALRNSKEVSNQTCAQNGTNKPLPQSTSKQRVTFESTAVLIERTPSTPGAPGPTRCRLSTSPSSPTPLMLPLQEYMEHERETSLGSHSDTSCRPFLRRSTSQPCGMRPSPAASPQLQLPPRVMPDTDSSAVVSDEPDGWVVMDGEHATNSDGRHTDTTTSGSSDSRAVTSRRDKDKYNYAAGLHSEGFGAVKYATLSSVTRLSDTELEKTRPDIHAKGIGVISPPTLQRIKSKIHERQYGSSVDVSRNYMYPGQYSSFSPKSANSLVLPRQDFYGSVTRKSPSEKRRRPVSASFVNEDKERHASHSKAVPVRKSSSFHTSSLNMVSRDFQSCLPHTKTPCYHCDTTFLTLTETAIPDRPRSPVPPKSPRMRRSSSSSHSSGSSRNTFGTSPNVLLPLSTSSHTLQPLSTSKVRWSRSTSSSSLGRVDEQEAFPGKPSPDSRPWFGPARHSYLDVTGLDGKSQTSRSSADGSPSTPRSIHRHRAGKRRQLPDIAFCIQRTQGPDGASLAPEVTPTRNPLQPQESGDSWI